MRQFCCLALVAACGRANFDRIGAERTDAAPVGHDEDGDGVADTADLCPHIADDQADADLDGVGDVCDPNPGSADDRRALFASLTPDDQPLAFPEGNWQQTPDGVVLTADYGDFTLELPSRLAHLTVRIGYTIDAVRPTQTSQRQISLHVADDLSVAHRFVELNEVPGTGVNDAAITQFTPPATFAPVAADTLPTGMHPGNGFLQSTHDADGLQLDGGWTNEVLHVVAPPDGFTGAREIFVNFNRLDVVMRYVWIVGS